MGLTCFCFFMLFFLSPSGYVDGDEWRFAKPPHNNQHTLALNLIDALAGLHEKGVRYPHSCSKFCLPQWPTDLCFDQGRPQRSPPRKLPHQHRHGPRLHHRLWPRIRPNGHHKQQRTPESRRQRTPLALPLFVAVPKNHHRPRRTPPLALQGSRTREAPQTERIMERQQGRRMEGHALRPRSSSRLRLLSNRRTRPHPLRPQPPHVPRSRRRSKRPHRPQTRHISGPPPRGRKPPGRRTQVDPRLAGRPHPAQ